MRKIGRVCIWIIVLTAILSLSACGRQERQRGIDGYVYEAELVTDIEDWACNFKVSGGWLYYTGYGDVLYRIPVGEDGVIQGRKAEKVPGGEEIQDYTLDAEGNIYCYKAPVHWLESGYAQLQGGTLARYREDGSLDFQISLDGWSGAYASLRSVPGFLAVGSPDQVFLLSGDTVLAIDGTGKIISQINISANRPEDGSFGTEKLLEGGDGKVYYLAEHTGQQTIYELVWTGDSFRPQAVSGEGWEGKESRAGNFFGSPDGILYSGLDGILQRYNSGKGKWQEVLNWSDSNLWQDTQEVAWFSEDRILVYFISQTEGKVGNEFYLLHRRRIEELPEKEELVLVCQGFCSDSLEDGVVGFNRTSEQYHITIQVYEGEDAFTRLDTSLVSNDPPDLLDLSGLDVAKYGGKQALEDLSPYLEGSSLLRREDFLEGILEGYTVDGRLVGIPSSFVCHTLLGDASEVGNRAGWKMEDMFRLTEEYPGRKLNGRSFYRNLDMICGDYIMNHFIDREKGECDFDSEEFCSLIVWLAEHSGSGTDYYDYEEVENPLIVWDDVSGILDFIMDISRSGKELTVIGYPSIDGAPLHHAWTYNAAGIPSKSRNKEGAWQFIEYFLSQRTWAASGYMPARRDVLEEMLEDAVTPVYRMVDGEIWLDGEGNPEKAAKWVAGRRGEGMVKYDCATREEADALLDMIAHTDFSPEGGLKSEVISIIMEETAGYFSGDKSVEEATKIIQNRVSVMVQENW